jgi:transcriptional regulator with XRE-family HTH domain
MARRGRRGGPEFAAQLDALRRQRGLNQRELADAVGAWESDVSRWLRGGGISLENVRALADYFGVERALLEQLAGYGTSKLASVQAGDEIERQRWRSWFDELREKRVPQRMWVAYTEACERLADAYREAEGSALSNLGLDPPSTPRPSSASQTFEPPTPPNESLRRSARKLAPC